MYFLFLRCRASESGKFSAQRENYPHSWWKLLLRSRQEKLVSNISLIYNNKYIVNNKHSMSAGETLWSPCMSSRYIKHLGLKSMNVKDDNFNGHTVFFITDLLFLIFLFVQPQGRLPQSHLPSLLYQLHPPLHHPQ